ncbi:MAG TPA: protealysin inhibitor emfourin [Polyangia bacterium]|nr:protealysin inhibitor emfourin [Polyangia bacterium]
MSRLLLLAALWSLAGSSCAHNPSAAHPLEVERLGGLAGYGGSRLRSRGQIDVSTLSAEDRQTVESLFSVRPGGTARPDEFRYKLTRWTSNGPQTVEVTEDQVPAAVRSVVRDQLQ